MRYCGNCAEKVESKGFCRACRMPVCKSRFGWIHDLTGMYISTDPFIHAATPGGRQPKKKGKVAA